MCLNPYSCGHSFRRKRNSLKCSKKSVSLNPYLYGHSFRRQNKMKLTDFLIGSQSLFVWTFLSECRIKKLMKWYYLVSILIRVDIPFGAETILAICLASFVSILICVDIPFGDAPKFWNPEDEMSQSLFVWTFLSEPWVVLLR